MAEVNGNFDFKKYDVGGTGATANDGKLTGQEAQNARADGWTIWDGFSEENETPENVNQRQNSSTAQGGSLSDRLGNIKLPQWANDLISRGQQNDQSGVGTAPIGNKTPIKLPAGIEELIAKNKPTEEQRNARAELGKKSANGMTYDEAYKKMKDIQAKYTRPLNENGGTYFSPEELPSDVKAEYKQVVLAMKEILDNNQELAEKAKIRYIGIEGSEWGYTIIADPVSDYDNKGVDKSDNSTPAPKLSEDKQKALEALLRKWNSPQVNGKPIDDVIADLTGKNDGKLTAEQKEARAELNQKQSSIGMTYADAKAKVAEILQKYPNCYDIIEIPYNNKEHADENGAYTLEYRSPEQRKVFNPDKLPEPARTEYKEAMASMTEIENANSALAQKGGINVNPIKNESARHSMFDNFDSSAFEGIGFKLAGKPEPTETQKTARAKLNEKVSSTGISYKDAKATIENITKQYKNNPDYQSEFAQEQPKSIKVYYPPVKAFDPYKLKGADREVYFKALSAIHEIETANYALLTQAGLEPTKDPEVPKSNVEYFAKNRFLKE